MDWGQPPTKSAWATLWNVGWTFESGLYAQWFLLSGAGVVGGAATVAARGSSLAGLAVSRSPSCPR